MAEITLSGTAFPSYAAVADADAYLIPDPGYHALWADLDADAKGRALIAATRHLKGLRWQTGSAPETDAPVQSVIDATSLLAAMISQDAGVIGGTVISTSSEGTGDVKRVKADTAEVEFFEKTESTTAEVLGAKSLPDRVLVLLSGLLFAPGAGRSSGGASPYDAGTADYCSPVCESGLTGSL